VTTEVADPSWAAYDLPLLDRSRSESAAPLLVLAEGDDQLLLQNGAWFCSLRWLVIAALLGMAILAGTAGNALLRHGIRLDPAWPLAVAAILVVVNVTYLAMVRMALRDKRLASLARHGLWLQIMLDLAVLTVVVHYLGSLETYAPFMYLFHIVLACIFFPRPQSLLVTVSAMGMYLACILLESLRAISFTSVLASPLMPDRTAVPWAIVAWDYCSVVFISGTVWYLASRLAGALRQRDAEMAAINRRLVAATEERARYMLHTTHQLKAPFAAIHANTQLLLGGFCGPVPEGAVTVIEQIAARCEMLSRAIKAMLQLANLRSHALNPPQPVPIKLPALVRSCLANLQPQAAKRGIVLDEDLPDASVWGVPDHVLMMIDNVLSNAISYSRDGQHVAVSCRAKPGGGATVTVRDTGIGIPAEKLPRIFDDYFRTNEAVAHNKASTGLGLAIVRQAALTGRIGVHVKSAPAQGTVFSLDFPAPDAGEKGTGPICRNGPEGAAHKLDLSPFPPPERD
jgi:two-component system, OmpR family, phosphate regulon sensor histidine kinase PhoR